MRGNHARLGAHSVARLPRWQGACGVTGVWGVAALLECSRLPAMRGAVLGIARGSGASVALNLPAHGVAVVGTLTGGLPTAAIPAVSDLSQLRLPALGSLVVG